MLLINNNLTPTFATSNMEDVKHPASEGVFNLLIMTTAIVPYSKTILLSQGKEAIVGWWWHSWVSQWKWYAGKHGRTYYAMNRRIKGITMLMHRLIIKANGLETDHINRNGLDNTECNLRKATRIQNLANRKAFGASGYLGVHRYKKILKDGKHNYWVAAIVYNKKRDFIGSYPFTEEGKIQAARAYDARAKELHGEFANLNFI